MSMVVSDSPKRWDPVAKKMPQLAGMSYHLYTTYSPCLLGGLYATYEYHLLGEPETTIELICLHGQKSLYLGMG